MQGCATGLLCLDQPEVAEPWLLRLTPAGGGGPSDAVLAQYFSHKLCGFGLSHMEECILHAVCNAQCIACNV